MKTRTWYIIQTARNLFVQWDEVFGEYAEGWGEDNAARLPSVGKARQVFREFGGGQAKREGARRFPRVLKVTQETKTIKKGRM